MTQLFVAAVINMVFDGYLRPNLLDLEWLCSLDPEGDIEFQVNSCPSDKDLMVAVRLLDLERVYCCWWVYTTSEKRAYEWAHYLSSQREHALTVQSYEKYYREADNQWTGSYTMREDGCVYPNDLL